MVDVSTVDESRTGSLTLAYVDGEQALPGVQAQAYCIARVAHKYPAQEKYEDLLSSTRWAEFASHTSLATRSDWDAVAKTIADYLIADTSGMYVPEYTGQADNAGTIRWNNMPACIYLVVTRNYTADDESADYIFTPLLASIPSANEQGEFIYSTVVEPKFSRVNHTPKNYKVVKLWDDTSVRATRPQSVDVDIYRDGKIWRQVQLSGSNEWMYEWKDLSGEHDFTVVERNLPEGYTVTNTINGGTFTITNSSGYTVKRLAKSGFAAPGWWILPGFVALGTVAFIALVALGNRREEDQ